MIIILKGRSLFFTNGSRLRFFRKEEGRKELWKAQYFVLATVDYKENFCFQQLL